MKNNILYSIELDILINLNCHGIASVIDAFVSKNSLYYVLEYIEGNQLDSIEFKIDMFNKSDIIGLVYKLSIIIDYLHSIKPYSVIHCDIKPDNIIVDNFLNIFLIDFDSAFYYNEFLGQNISFGTKEYSSPEQILFPNQINTSSDIYSFGKVVLYIMSGYFIKELFQIAMECTELIPCNRPSSMKYIINKIKLLL
ncbi:protein kinase domain-containing protein [Helicovermis profundi]